MTRCTQITCRNRTTKKMDRFHNARKRQSCVIQSISKTKLSRKSNEFRAPALPATDVPCTTDEAVGFQRPLGESERALILSEMDQLRKERDEARRERDAVERFSRERLCANAVRENDAACSAMTGLTWAVFSCLHKFISQFIKPRRVFKMSTEDQLFLTLLKLRQNPSIALLCQVLTISKSTVHDIITRWVDMMYAKITFLLNWPDRECITSTMPPDMHAKFPRLTSIIDCFEIRIEYSRTLKARAKTYSHYKKWTTVKYFISCSPAGSITFLSKGWGGRASDVKIVRESGFISPQFHQPGDQILADRGFTLQEDFAVLGVSLITPAFTKGRKQLSGREVEESRVKSNVRIHIERVIGVLKNRFHILDGPLPVQFVKSLRDEKLSTEEATVDKIVHVCAALVNLSSSVVSPNSH